MAHAIEPTLSTSQAAAHASLLLMDARQMIESISLKKIATYSPDTFEHLTDLKAVNVIYGANGAGKTTISRLIADPTISSDSRVNWKNATPIQAMVYNSDFIADNYSEAQNLKGVFTLGKAEKEHLDRLEELQADRKRFEQLRDRTLVNLNGEGGEGGKNAERSALEARLVTRCWEQKTKHDELFGGAFKGVRNSKDGFKARVLQESASNRSAIAELDDLKTRASVLYGQAPSALVIVPTFDLSLLISLETNQVLTKKIIGKGDVDVAALIDRLGNSDWVRQGIKYLEHSSDHCPFCQQSISHDFENKLIEYFDEAFEADMRALSAYRDAYFSRADEISLRAERFFDVEYQHVDKEMLGLEFKALGALLQVNKERIAAKVASPSSEIVLESVAELHQKIDDLISAANAKVVEHNRLVTSFTSEQTKLTSEVWKYLLEVELKKTLSEYAADSSRLDKAIEGLTGTLEKAKSDISQANVEIDSIESQLTSVQPTVIEINKLLTDFGFHSFSLAVAPGENSYKLLRPDGTSAYKTLSEGEKTFVTFLYFFHLLRGSITTTGITAQRIVVIDDPVSSLDSDVLFIVGSLIKQLFTDVQKNGAIKQVFVLTHNVHFHKEITFNQRRDKEKAMPYESFWVVRKPDRFSKVERHHENPIKTSYQLLWSELRKDPLPTLTLQNTMRRILENYFKILGGIDYYDLLNKFEGQERLQCQSLISWVNDGSHYSPDDLYLAIGERTAASYMKIFFKIFRESDHLAHYKMMMGDDFEDLAPLKADAAGAVDEAVEAEVVPHEGRAIAADDQIAPAAIVSEPEGDSENEPMPEPGFVVPLPLAVSSVNPVNLNLLPPTTPPKHTKPRPVTQPPAQPGLLPPGTPEDDLDIPF